jgi:hypothetical protein
MRHSFISLKQTSPHPNPLPKGEGTRSEADFRAAPATLLLHLKLGVDRVVVATAWLPIVCRMMNADWWVIGDWANLIAAVLLAQHGFEPSCYSPLRIRAIPL